jgi:hypothetical protein
MKITRIKTQTVNKGRSPTIPDINKPKLTSPTHLNDFGFEAGTSIGMDTTNKSFS